MTEFLGSLIIANCIFNYFLLKKVTKSSKIEKLKNYACTEYMHFFGLKSAWLYAQLPNVIFHTNRLPIQNRVEKMLHVCTFLSLVYSTKGSNLSKQLVCIMVTVYSSFM